MQKNDLKSLVVFSNDLLNSEYYCRPELDLTLNQKKLIYYLMSKVDREATSFSPEQVNIRDYCHLFNINEAGSNHKWLIDSLVELAGKQVMFKLKDGGIRIMSWLEYIDVYPGKGIIYFKLAERLSEYLQQLSKRFTQAQLLYLAQFRSKYAADLYLLCKAHGFKRNFYLSYDDVRKILLHGDNDKYPRYFDFAKRILNPAIEAINENSDITVTVKPMKEKNRITNLAFRVLSKSKQDIEGLKIQQLFDDPSRKEELREQLNDVLGEDPYWPTEDRRAVEDCTDDEAEVGCTGYDELIKILGMDVTEE